MTKPYVGGTSKQFLHLIVFFSMLLPVCLQAAPVPSGPDSGESNRIDAIKSLGLESIPGSMRAFYRCMRP